MLYAEAAYFDGDHCQHCADRDENLHRERIEARARVARRRALPFADSALNVVQLKRPT